MENSLATAHTPMPGQAATEAATWPVITANYDADDGYFDGILGAVIAAVALVLVCLAVLLIRYVCRHKGSYRTDEAKGAEFAQTADMALRGDPALPDATDQGKKEYFI